MNSLRIEGVYPNMCDNICTILLQYGLSYDTLEVKTRYYCCPFTTDASTQLVFYHIKIIYPTIFHMTDPGELVDVDNCFESWGFCENQCSRSRCLLFVFSFLPAA